MTATDPSHGVAVDPGLAPAARRAGRSPNASSPRYAERTVGSQAATARARKVLPARRAVELPGLRPAPDRRPPRAGLADGRRRRQRVRRLRHGLRRAVRRPHASRPCGRPCEAQLDDGTLYVTPCELNAEVAELLAERYGLPMWRFTNSGTEATMDAIRVAQGVTGRDKIVKVEGGYHGHHDEVMISMKPPLDAGRPGRRAARRCPARRASPRRSSPTRSSSRTTTPTRSSGCWRAATCACFIVEPVMENIGICLPRARLPRGGPRDHRAPRHAADLRRGQDRHHRRLRRRHRSLRRRSPTSSTLAKSIGGGFPVGAFGGKAEYMDLITAGQGAPPRHVQRQPARDGGGARPTLTEACSREPTTAAIARNDRLVDACQRDHRRRRPAGPHRAVRRQGLRHVVADAGPQLPRLQGDRLRPGVRAVDPRHQPRRAAAAGPRRAVADLGDARRRRRDALRRGVRASSSTSSRAEPAPRRATSGAGRRSGRTGDRCRPRAVARRAGEPAATIDGQPAATSTDGGGRARTAARASATAGMTPSTRRRRAPGTRNTGTT